MRHIEKGAQWMSHSMIYAQAHIRKSHACHILGDSHTISTYRIRWLADSQRQILVNHLYSLHLEHVAQFPSSLCDEAFDGMSHRIHTSRGCEAFGQ